MGATNAEIEALYNELGPALLAYARSLLPDAASAEDAVQRVFLKLISRPAALPAEPRPYLFRAVRNTALNRLRAVSREISHSVEPRAIFVAPDELSAAVGDLERALAGLPDEQREVVMLHVWGGLTFEAAARVIGVPASTAASRYRYGLTRLRERLSNHLKANHARPA